MSDAHGDASRADASRADGEREGVGGDVRAVYELPVPVWVMAEALERTYEAGYPSGTNLLQFSVVMPTDRMPIGGPPPTDGAEDVAGEVVWAIEYGAEIPPTRQPALAVHRVAFINAAGPTPPGREWFTTEYQLAEYADRWFEAVRTWVEVLTRQDLDPNHRIYDAELHGTRLAFISPPGVNATSLTASVGHVVPVTAGEWAQLLSLVAQGVEPPLEEVVARDARAAQRRGANRRAVIDAATAIEIALSRLVRAAAPAWSEKQRNRIKDSTTLGGYVTIAADNQIPLTVAISELRAVTKARNDAAHRGAAADALTTSRAVRTMTAFLAAHSSLRRPT